MRDFGAKPENMASEVNGIRQGTKPANPEINKGLYLTGPRQLFCRLEIPNHDMASLAGVLGMTYGSVYHGIFYVIWPIHIYYISF